MFAVSGKWTPSSLVASDRSPKKMEGIAVHGSATFKLRLEVITMCDYHVKQVPLVSLSSCFKRPERQLLDL